MTKKKNLTAFMIAIIVMLFLLPANAQGTVGYVEWDKRNTTLTFKGGKSVPTLAYALNTGDKDPNWNSIARFCTTVVFDKSFKDVRPTYCRSWFKGFSILSTIKGIEYLNTDSVTNMHAMFQNCSKLTILDVSKFNTDNVTTMQAMFYGCSGLTTLNVSKFNTAKVTDMSYMFYGCSGLTSLDLSKFNTAKVTDMSYMFNGCSKLTSLDLSSFNTANVKSMYNMFDGCSGLTSLNVSKFNTDNVTDMSYMFENCSKLTSLDVSNFNTANVTDMRYMFYGCSGLTSLDVSNFNTDKVTTMYNMFYGCSGLTSLDVSNFNNANVTNMSSMFSNCSMLESLNVSKFNTANVTDMSYMFSNCSNLTSLDVSSFNTANVTDMKYMFYKCSGLTSLDVSKFNTAKVSLIHNMFDGCSGLTKIYVSDDFTTYKVSISIGMFKDCTNLNGAVAFDPNKKTDKDMANYKTGYFKTYYKLGENQVDLCGETLTTTSLYLSGDNDFVAHAHFTVNTVTYTRNLSSSTSTWFSLCLPFAYTPKNFTAYQLKGATEKAVEIEQITGAIVAGTPIIFKFKDDADKNINITATDAKIVKAPVDGTTVSDPNGSSLQLCGTYQNKSFSKEDNNDFILLNDKLMNPAEMLENKNVTKVGVKPFRGYMTMTSQAGASAKSFSIGSGEEGTTAIDLLNSVATGDAEYYDINGRRIDAPAKGVNIVRRGNKTMKLIIK